MTYSGDIASSNMGIDAEIAQAREQQRQQAAQEAASRARASSASKAAAKPSAAQLKFGAMSDVDNAFSNNVSQTDVIANNKRQRSKLCTIWY